MSDVHAPIEQPDVYGVLAEFQAAEQLVEAARRVREAGYKRFDAFAPMPIHGLAESMGARATRLPLIVLAGGIIGGSLGYLMQWYMTVVSYPLNIGGRPLHSWPSFIPVTFELTVLGAALAAVLGMLALNGLPRPHHPLFGVPEFSMASQNRFFLCIESADATFDAATASDFLHGLGAVKTTVVEN